MSHYLVREGEHGLLDNPLWRAALVVEAAALLGDLVGSTLHLPHLRAISKVGEAVGFTAGYVSVMHQIEVEDKPHSSNQA
jgi:hypothetical protein